MEAWKDEAPSTLFPALLGKGWHKNSHKKLSSNSRLFLWEALVGSSSDQIWQRVFSCFRREDLKRLVLWNTRISRWGHGLPSSMKQHLTAAIQWYYLSVCVFVCSFLLLLFLCCGHMVCSYSPLLSTCIEEFGTGFLGIMLLHASSSCCPFSRLLCAQSPEWGSWALRASPNALSSIGWDSHITGFPTFGW